MSNYYDETSREIAQQLEASGCIGPYLEELRRGKPSITSCWSYNPDETELYPQYTQEEEGFLETVVVPELERVAREASECGVLYRLRSVIVGLATGSIRDGEFAIHTIHNRRELEPLREILRRNRGVYSSIGQKVYDATSKRWEKTEPYDPIEGTGRII